MECLGRARNGKPVSESQERALMGPDWLGKQRLYRMVWAHSGLARTGADRNGTERL